MLSGCILDFSSKVFYTLRGTLRKGDFLMKEFDDLLQYISDEQLPYAKELMHEMAFMRETLDELKDEIKKHGTVTEFKQGKQEFLKENPALKAYNTTSQRYKQFMNDFMKMLPKGTQATNNDEEALADFLDVYV